MAAAVDTAETRVVTAENGRRASGVRAMIDALMCLTLAVILVRSFVVEGYMISTGSMAPTLPGFHKRATCPKCGYEFAVGTTGDSPASHSITRTNFENTATPPSIVSNSAPVAGHFAVCPNCSFDAIDLSKLPQTQGDQLLVFKNAFMLREPRRWEVLVFRNPTEPSQAYVKRIVGLPGETVALKDGDLWIDGQRERKSLDRQNAVAILVYDHNYEPKNDPDWNPRWTVATATSGWNRDGAAFVIPAKEQGGDSSIAWLNYRHWIRRGGRHRTAVGLPATMKGNDPQFPSLYPVQYDAKTHEFWHQGVLADETARRIANVFNDPSFKTLMDRLAEQSHNSPITDDYGYNRAATRYRPNAVRDVMLKATVKLQRSAGRFLLEMTDGQLSYTLSIHPDSRIVTLDVSNESKPVRSVRLKREAISQELPLTMSLFDRQVIVALGDHVLFEPLLLKDIPPGGPAPRRPVRIGADGVAATVSDLQIFRDIYYTSKGSGRPFQLADEEYYVLGDNSPISADSRVWEHAGVNRRLFLGKPILVHLPSRPGNFTVGGRELRVRIPDFSRIRYIR